MRIVVCGDIVGSPGRRVFGQAAQYFRTKLRADLVVANGENAAGGRGITPALADELFTAGADVITLGDHTWDQKEIVSYLAESPRLLRPANFPGGVPGRGWCVTAGDHPVLIINLIGRVFMAPVADCPFRKADEILGSEAGRTAIRIVDFHAEATSEKKALGYYLAGRVSAVVGSHTHVATADEGILPGGTAFVTDVGMTGPHDSVLGRDRESVLQKFLSGMPARFKVASCGVACEAVLIEVDSDTGRARDIRRVRWTEDGGA
ncbi:MAG TPA: TIGR00282 family metallophosphoesterase [Kiritimatiellae bacterium]|nr:TIGR00282 family metallophosphoesterase [Kiritimatiellia bacterium]